MHRVLRNREVPGAQRFHWVDPAAAHLGLRPWLRPAVSAAVDALTALQNRLGTWTQGLLHADPAPEAFRLDVYQATTLLGEREIEEGLPVMLRFRWAVQADYFAWRITANDMTGIAGPEENDKGLEDARQALVDGGATGVRTLP